MNNSQEPQNNLNFSHSTHQRNLEFIQAKQDIFAFLRKEERSSLISSPPFFSENGLSQDIIKVTNAEPDICLEGFYALYHTLWPQIENDSDMSIKDAWTGFIGGSTFKGSLCPPERLMTERRIRDIKKLLSQNGGENQVFHDLDQAMSSISYLKEKIENHHSQILQKEEIMASLSLVQEFYLSYRSKVNGLIQAIIEKEQNNVLHTSESEALEDLLEPKAIMMSDIFAHHWAYRISRNQAQKILSKDVHGRNLKTNLSDPANHRVIALPENSNEPLVFFKANGNPPIQPEKEFMLYSLYRHLQIPVPETALLILTDVYETKPKYFYAVQASEAVLGQSPLRAYQDPETTLDREAYSLQVIGALLTNPSDGSFKNFKYNPKYQTFISIDNDMVFKPELRGKDDIKVVNVKSMLYLLPQIDLLIPESIKTLFKTLDPYLITLSWLQDLSQKNRDYQLLFTRLAFQRTRCIYQNLLPQSEVPSLAICLQNNVQVDPELQSDSFYPQILLSKDLLTCFVEKLKRIEKTFLTNRPVSPQVLFEEICPAIGKYYRKLRFEFSDPEAALEALWGHKKNDVDYSEISSLLDQEELTNLPRSSNEIEENLSPETFFKEFQDLLISGETPLDKFIRRHNERKKKNTLNLRVALNELQFLIQKGLTRSQSFRDIVNFCHSLSKVTENRPHLIKEITSLLCNIPHQELKWLLTLEKFFLRPDQHVSENLISSSQSVLGAFMKKRTLILSKSESQYLFDQQGNIQKKASLTGRLNVTCFPEENPEFYLKQYPEWPGYEFASTLFMRLLGVKHLPYQDLLIIKNYPVLLSQKADGDLVLHIWKNPKAFNNLDPFHTGLLIISAMLLNPEDGKEDNLLLSPDKKYIIPIDGDHCLLPSTLQKEGSFLKPFTVNTALQTKTILFCLDEMYRPIPLEVQQHILSLDFDLLLTEWIAELDKIENKLNNLIDQNQRNKFLEQGTVMRIPFYKQFIENIHWKAHKIKNLLKAAYADKITITPFDLLKAVEPFAAKCYENSFKQGNNLQSRFKAATNELYQKPTIDGSRISVLNTRAMMEIIHVSEKDLQNDTMFQRMGPVDALELLNRLIPERGQKTTMEQEMLCEIDDKKQENRWISLFGNPPGETALKAFFTNPKEGLILKGSKLITSSKLTELFTREPHTGAKIRFLSLPESPLLSDKEIRILAKECPNIEYLNVSGCPKLKQLITMEREWTLLYRLEAKDCLNLEKLVSYSPMKILRVETDQEIEIFVEKPTLEIFIISKKERNFEFSFKKGEKAKIKSGSQTFSHQNFFLHFIYGKEEIEKYFRKFKFNLQISSILSGKIFEVFPTSIDLTNSKIQTEEIKKIVQLSLRNLESLNLSKNENIRPEGLEYLIQGEWPKLNHLDLSENQKISDEGIEVLCRGNWPLLETLNLSKTNVTARGVKAIVNRAKMPQLKHFNLSDNEICDEGFKILVLNYANWPFLEDLNFQNTNITTKSIEILMNNISIWPNLKRVNASHNSIQDEGLEILISANWPLLESLNLSSTEITTQGFEDLISKSKWHNLKELDISFNPIQNEGLERIALAKWPLFESLNLSSTKITTQGFQSSIRKSEWPNLKKLNVSLNQIENEGLEIIASSNWNQLEHLNLEKTEITDQGIEFLTSKSYWPNLKELDLSDNGIWDQGLKTLSSGKWPQLESLYLRKIEISGRGVLGMIRVSEWPRIKTLDLSENLIFTETHGDLQFSEFPLLEYLNLKNTDITGWDMFLMCSERWTCLKEIHFQNLDNQAMYWVDKSQSILCWTSPDGKVIIS